MCLHCPCTSFDVPSPHVLPPAPARLLSLHPQSRAVRAQAEGFAEWEAALRKEMGAAVERLRSYEGFLGQVGWETSHAAAAFDVGIKKPCPLRARVLCAIAVPLQDCSTLARPAWVGEVSGWDLQRLRRGRGTNVQGARRVGQFLCLYVSIAVRG